VNIGRINRVGLIASFLFICHSSFAQSILQGKVEGIKRGEPLAGAFVIGMSSSVQKCFSFTDGNGEFNLKIPSDVKIDAIRVSLVGYANKTIKYNGEKYLSVKLIEKKTELAASKVTASSVEEKGDTLVYAIGAFKDGNERVLGDLLSKLPDVTITKSGGILYRGEYINKFYVEGMDLMGSRYGVVTNNLNANDISRIEIYKNHQPKKALEGISNTDRGAVNIILKESAKESWLFTGDAAIGAPKFPLFDIKAMVTRFSKTNQSLFLMKGNNIGKAITKEIREQRYFGKVGAFLISYSDMDSDFKMVLSRSKTPLPLPEEYWYDNTSAIASVNHISRLGGTKTLRLSFNMAGEKYREVSENVSTISFADGSRLMLSQGDSLSDASLYVSGSVLYENNAADKFVSNDLAFAFQGKDVTSDIYGLSRYNQKYKLPSFKLSDTFMRTFRLSGRQALDFTSDNKLVRSSHDAIFKDETDSSAQTYIFTRLQSDNIVAYKKNISGHLFNVTAGLALGYIDIESSLNDGLRGLGISETGLSLFSTKPYARLLTTFKLRKGDISVSLPLSLNYLAVSDADNVFYPEFSPRISMRYMISKNWEWDTHVGVSTSHSSAETLLNAFVMRDYRTFAKSDSLRRSNVISASTSLKYSDYLSMFFASLGGNLHSIRENRSASGNYFSEYTQIYYAPGLSLNTNYGVNANLKKYIGVKTLVLEFRGDLSGSDTDGVLQGVDVKYHEFTRLMDLRLSSNPAEWISLGLSSRFMWNTMTGDAEAKTSSIHLNGDIHLKPVDKLTLSFMGDYLKENVPGVEISNIPLLKSSISYSFPNYTVFAECRNILNAKEYRRETISTFTNSSSLTKLRGRQFLVGIRMSL